MKQADIIPPIDPRIIRSELNKDLLLRKTNRAGNELYAFHAHEAPNTMLEIGRLREAAFRPAGAGSGKAADIDEYDIEPDGYKQLIVWDPHAQEILGGYRYIVCDHAIETSPDGTRSVHLSSSELFEFTDIFIDEYLPKTIELGRSFVRNDLQNTGKGKIPRSIFTLDNLWDGLGALTLLHDDCQYFFGKMTMYENYNIKARDLIYYYLATYFKPREQLVRMKFPIPYQTPTIELEEIIKGKDAKADYKAMNKAIREMGTAIPPLVNAYISLTDRLIVFGTSYNPFFGNALEACILVPIEEITPDKKKRHIDSFLRDAPRLLSQRLIRRIQARLKRLNKDEEHQSPQHILPHLE
ncbi:GNAT family N-acetyltransferase [Porphyromonas levii]|uniref:GNAT family N-acetyltransferase n=2 Tax=Porphyromonas levii TaxID=28114 RepID=UPI001BAA6079|nr:GNAT family N-acetyltransferase [Porphyromonas levii]MBR8806275.1 hypothetical protein [Porphyromonas levii]